MDDNTPIGVDLGREPVVTEVDGGRMLTWPGCRAFVPGPLGKAEASSAKALGCRSHHGAPQDPVEALLAELWPQIERCTTAKALGAVILAAEVDPKLKHALGRAARDRLGASWSDGTVKAMLTWKAHTDDRAEMLRKASRIYSAKPEVAERKRGISRTWYAENADRARKTSQMWKDANREHTREASRAWAAENPGYHNDYNKNRRRSDEVVALAERVRGRIAHALRAARAGKAGKSLDLLGCTPAAFKAHLESQWTEGMDWSTYGNGPGLWVVDHVVPVAAFDLTTEEGQRQAFHFTNCQPMWFEENAAKSSHHDGRRWTHGDHA